MGIKEIEKQINDLQELKMKKAMELFREHAKSNGFEVIKDGEEVEFEGELVHLLEKHNCWFADFRTFAFKYTDKYKCYMYFTDDPTYFKVDGQEFLLIKYMYDIEKDIAYMGACYCLWDLSDFENDLKNLYKNNKYRKDFVKYDNQLEITI